MALIRLAEVKEYTGLGRSSIYKYMNDGLFPKSVSLGDRAIAWVDTEVIEWVQDKIDLRDELEQSSPTKEKRQLAEVDVTAWIKDKFKTNSLSESIEWLMKVMS
ncbi:MAG: AlpA family transcriptional regulator [Colwellia sp.]|nr:MAG: AlpA family transcriptional regulator [Colwellia sp.]